MRNRVAAGLLAWFAMPAIAAQPDPQAVAGFDVLIRNGSLLDGTGALAVTADVGIQGGFIRFIGDGSQLSAARIIDATGLVVAPGFIDVHSHADGVLAEAGASAADRGSLATSSQGITTAVFGPDGFYSPATIGRRIADFQARGVGVNYAFYVGHNGIRSEVMADPHAKASAVDILRMAEQVRRGMDMGAVGLSTGLMYDPGMYADTDEVVALAAQAAPFHGIYDSHVRDPVFRLIESDKEALDIARRAGIGAKIAHEKAPGLMNHGRAIDIVALINRERSQGRDVVADQYPYDGASTGLLKDVFILPDKARKPGAGTPARELLAMLVDPRQRAELRAATEHGVDGGFSWLKAVGYGGLRIVVSPRNAGLIGKNIERLAAERGSSGFDVLADLVIADGEIRLTMADIDETDIRLIMVQPWTMIASDGNGIDSKHSPSVCGHPRSMGTFPRVLGRYVRDLGVLSLPDAIRKMTALPADYLQLRDRGRLTVGHAADVTIFDADAIGDRATYASPCELSVGVAYVLINGITVFADGKSTGALPGRFVSRQPPREPSPQ